MTIRRDENMKIKILQVFKMALAFFLAMSIAQIAGFQYAASAGIVGLLTIQSTKKETLYICLKRIFSFCVALTCAFVVFLTLGYSPLTFSLFLILFVGISFITKLQDGIAMNAVITTHYLLEKSMSLSWVYNEFMIFMIGISVGIVINLYMPSQKQSIQQSLSLLDQRMKDLILNMSGCLLKEKKSGSLFSEFEDVFSYIDEMSKQAYQEMNNRLLNDTKYEFQYLMMRKNQLSILQDIYELIVQIDFTGEQAKTMSSFLKKVSLEYHENNDVKDLKEDLKMLNRAFQQDCLPQTREEFENRAILFTILRYLEKFIHVKYEFVHE